MYIKRRCLHIMYIKRLEIQLSVIKRITDNQSGGQTVNTKNENLLRYLVLASTFPHSPLVKLR